MSEKKPATPVGYRQPPVHSRFKPGQSGNPKGRPKKRPSLSADLTDELSELVPAREGDEEIRITRQRALVKKLMAMALKGNIRAVNIVLALCSPSGDGEAEQGEEPAPIDQEILQTFVERHGGKVERASDPTPSSTVNKEDGQQ